MSGYRIGIIALCLALAGLVWAGSAQALEPHTLRCEYLERPLTVETGHPRLDWQLKGDAGVRGERQTAYRILVASTPEALKSDTGDLWDSGKIESAETTQIAYNGQPLTTSRQRCYWKVKVWDQAGKESAWSESEYWQMGLLSASDWVGDLIGLPPADPKSVEGQRSVAWFRKEFAAGAKPVRAQLYVSALGAYDLHLNGRRVADEYFGPGWSTLKESGSGVLYYRCYDITDLIDERSNALGISVGAGWFGLHFGKARTRSGWGRYVLAQVHLEFADGRETIIRTDGSWKATREGPVRSACMYGGEVYDARREISGWTRPGFDDREWSAAQPEPLYLLKRDCTQLVRDAVRDGGLKMKPPPDLCVKPLRQFRVWYRQGDVSDMKEVNQKSELVIPAVAGQELTILRAEVGSQFEVRPIGHPVQPVRPIEELAAVGRTEPKPGVWVFDLGQNMVGVPRLKVQGAAGTEVTLRLAESISSDGMIDRGSLRRAEATDTYILSGKGQEVWQPRFTFHGFRYVEVTGYPGEPPLDAIRGVVLHTDLPLSSSFACSHAGLNRLYQNIVWGQRGNFLEIPTDCPQRDERLGWTGDIQVFCPTALYNMDAAGFLSNWLKQHHKPGDSVSPSYAFFGNSSFSAGWGDVGVTMPWHLYRAYGDRRQIEQRYEDMAAFIAQKVEYCVDGVDQHGTYGDWVTIGKKTSTRLLGTAYLAYSAGCMAELAGVLGKSEDEAKYRAIRQVCVDAFNRTFVDDQGRIRDWKASEFKGGGKGGQSIPPESEKIETQTGYLLPLAYDILPPEKRTLAFEHLVSLLEANDWRLTVGFLGVDHVLPVLSRFGRDDLAYRMLERTGYPSWLNFVEMGLTTIPELWNSLDAEGRWRQSKMNSLNHYIFGSCGEWMMHTMAGIAPAEPGYARVRIAPQPGGSITYCKAHYDSIRGRIATHWRREPGKPFELDVTIPPNVTAEVHLPVAAADGVTESGRPVSESKTVRVVGVRDGRLVLEIGSGTYTFTTPSTEKE